MSGKHINNLFSPPCKNIMLADLIPCLQGCFAFRSVKKNPKPNKQASQESGKLLKSRFQEFVQDTGTTITPGPFVSRRGGRPTRRPPVLPALNIYMCHFELEGCAIRSPFGKQNCMRTSPAAARRAGNGFCSPFSHEPFRYVRNPPRKEGGSLSPLARADTRSRSQGTALGWIAQGKAIIPTTPDFPLGSWWKALLTSWCSLPTAAGEGRGKHSPLV